ncbi:hypothetical protein ACJRO7_003378 [Eucalyptus globulus]|uniref:Uncharacterized protein n=1 Tax=Eucalyptus globulus TaxID=34317 RepID=A0ABD3IWR8_EUCGL
MWVLVGQFSSSDWFATKASVDEEAYSLSLSFSEYLLCLPPVHQMQQYYQLGVLDNCSGKWSTLVDWLALKTKQMSEVQEILETRETAKHYIWTFRTPEEASSHWKELFAHLDEP